MRRSLVVIPSAILLLLTALGAVGWFSLRHNITREAAAQIRPGMTRAEVEAILGGPAGSYYRWQATMVASAAARVHEDQVWIADDLAIVVDFDAASRVAQVDVMDVWHGRERGFFLSGKNWAPKFVQEWLEPDQDDPPELLIVD